MTSKYKLTRAASLAAWVLMIFVMTGCGGGSSSGPQPQAGLSSANPVPISTTPATGTLTVTVTDTEGRPLADAGVAIFTPSQSKIIGNTRTNSLGVATIESVPLQALVTVSHAFGEYYSNANVTVAQQGVTQMSVTMQPARPHPTVALLPVSILPGSISADRTELTLELTLVAASAAPFQPAGYGDYSPESTPSLGLTLGQQEDTGDRLCMVWLDRKRTAPACDAFSDSDGTYVVSVTRFTYDKIGSAPTLEVQGAARSALLIMDQSRRVAELDPTVRRSFALRRFIDRALSGPQPQSLSLAGFAGSSSSTTSMLPSQPHWLPLGAGNSFSTDGSVLKAAVGTLEPYVGGSAPVFESLQAAINLVTAKAPAGNRAIVAMLGGGDDRDMTEAARRSALGALRQQRDTAGIQLMLIAGAPGSRKAERFAVADLAAALRAPSISLGIHPDSKSEQPWTAGAFAAWDLAADLIQGVPLPTLSASFRIKAKPPAMFTAGTTLYGVIYVEADMCPMGCAEFPVEFAVEIP